MKTIDELISDAQKAYDDAPNEEKSEKRGALEALKRVKGEGVFTQADFNHHDKKLKQEYERDFRDVLGMDLKEAKEVFEQMDDDTLAALSDAFSGEVGDDEDDSGAGDENPRLQKVVGAVKKLQADRDGLSETLTDLNRRYAKDKVDVAVERAFRDAKLDVDTYLEPAKRLAAYDDLIERVTKGEQLTQEDIAAKVDSVKELSGVWFKEGDGDGVEGGDERDLRAGSDQVVIRPHIPPTSSGSGPPSRSATESYREAKYAARQTG